MKQIFICFCLLPILCISCNNEEIETSSFNSDGEPISMEQAKIIMERITSNVDFAYMFDIPIPSNSSFKVYDHKSKRELDKTTPQYDSWMFLVNPFYLSDMIPSYWDYYYVNALSGKIEHVRHESAPTENSGDLFSVTHLALLIDTALSPKTKSEEEKDLLRGFNPDPVVTHSGNTYAVIIDGGIEQSSNYMRYWNMCQFLYRTLKLKYGLDDDDIYTLICGGPSGNWYFSNGYSGVYYCDFDLDGIDDIDYSATATNIDTVFDDIADIATEGDNLLVFVTDHGGYKNEISSICLWGNEDYYPEDLRDQILKIDSGVRIHVVLGQCHSGGFINDLTRSNVSVTTSCLDTESANVYHNDPAFSEFLYHWICAMAQMTPSGQAVTGVDSNGDGFVSYYEAFQYAKNNDYYYLNQLDETPQHRSFTTYFGANYDIVGNYSHVPFFYSYNDFDGNVSYNTPKTLYVSDTPSGSTPSFSVSSNLYIVSQGSNYVTFRYNGYLPIYTGNSVSMVINYNGATYSCSKDNITGWRSGVYNGLNYITASYSGNPSRFTLPALFENCTSFVWSSSVPLWYPSFQGYHYVYFDTEDIEPQSYDSISVTFNNTLGESTTLTQSILSTGYTL